MAFGLMLCATRNLGDAIQSLAALRFLPSVEASVDRESLHRQPADPFGLGVILNGWFLHSPLNWPPAEGLRALAISMHVNALRSRRRPWRQAADSLLFTPAGIAWFQRHAPVGARDMQTLELLRRHGIDAYLSYCLTLTLPAPSVQRGESIIACDLSSAALAALRRQSDAPVVVVSHDDPDSTGAGERLRKAEALLLTYAGARAVVTSRLHCALPCLAMGTPVLYLASTRDRGRQEPALSLAHHATESAFVAGRTGFDLRAPPPNPVRHLPYAAEMVRRCESFVAAQMARASDPGAS